MVRTLVIFCLLCAGRCGAEGTAPNKLRSPRWRVRVNSEPYSATSLACIHTGICSIMNPNMTARNRKITTHIGRCGIRVQRLHGTIQLSFTWRKKKEKEMPVWWRRITKWTFSDVVVVCWFFLRLKRREGERAKKEKGERGNRQSEREGSLSTTGTTGPRAQLEGLWRGRSHLSYGDKRQMGAHYRAEC